MTLRRLSLPIDLLVVLFCLSGFIGYFAAYDRKLSEGGLFALLLALLVYLLAAHLVPSRDVARKISMGLVLVGGVFALVFIGQYGHQNYGETPDFIERIGQLTTFMPRIESYGMQPNAAATVVESLLPLTVFLALSSRRRWMQLGFAALGLVLFYAVILSFSRGALAGLAVALVALLLMRWSTRLALAFVGVVLVAGLFLVIINPPGLPMERINPRLDLFQNSFKLAQDYAFTGIGLGDTFPMTYSRFSLLIQVPFLTYPHNLYLSVWLSQGIIGVLLFAALLVIFYLYADRVLYSSDPSRLFVALVLGITVTLIHGLLDSRQYVEWYIMVELFALLGLAVALGRLALESAFRNKRDVPLRYIPRVLLVIVPLTLVALVVAFNRPLLAAWHTNLAALSETRAALREYATANERQQGYAQAVTGYNAALDIIPDWPNASRRLGNLNVALGSYAEAVPLLEQAQAQEGLYPAAVKGLGLAYVWSGQTEEAAAMLGQLPERDAMIDELLVWYQFRLENSEPLLAAYAGDAALVMAGENASTAIMLLVADRYAEAGEPVAARRWYDRVLEQEPDNPAAQDGLTALN